MKLFWAVVILLIAAAGAVLLWPTSAPPASPEPAPPPPGSITTPSDAPPASSATTPSPPPEDRDADLTTEQLIDRLRAEADRTGAESATAPPSEASLDSLLNLPSEPTPTPATAAAPPTTADSSAPSVPSVAGDASLAQHEAVSEVVPLRSRPGEDGWTILDERFPIRGAGTPEEPYEVSWDLLVSASETYQPRLGKTRIPERIAMLNNKHVRVAGYVAFPFMATEQNELLSMRNMWDGCCIGVPPTPYDAIEVRLRTAATGQDRFTAFGTIEGLFKVDPYVKGNWLLGLYLMEDAVLTKTRDVEMPTPTHERLPGF